MITILLNEKELKEFEKVTNKNKIDYEIVESKKFGGEEIIFQIIIPAIGIAVPYIIEYFRGNGKEKNSITLIKDGIKIKFENEEDLRKYLEENSKK